MWLWLQRSLPKAATVWAKLIVFSASFHLVILFMVFFIFKGETSGFNFQVNKDLLHSDAPVVFLPFHKRISSKAGGKAGKKMQQKASIVKPKVAEPVKEKKEPKVKKADIATTLVASRMIKKKEAATKKEAAAKKKAEALKIAEAQKEAEAKKLAEEPSFAKASADRQEKLIKKETQLAQNVDSQGNEIRYVGRDDLDALQMQEFINQEVGQHWNPPIGIPKDAACEIKLVVNWQGALNEIKMLAASGIAIYDISVRNAVQKMSFPKWLWGKEFSITFKQ